MASLDRLRAAVTAETTVGQSVIVLLNDISQKLKDAIASGNQEELDALAAELETNKAALATAVASNTPAANEPPPVV